MNRYYVRREDRHLAPALAAPVGPVDDFVAYRHVRVLIDSGELLDHCGGFGPNALRVACRLHAAARRFPGLASLCRRTMRSGWSSTKSGS